MATSGACTKYGTGPETYYICSDFHAADELSDRLLDLCEYGAVETSKYEDTPYYIVSARCNDKNGHYVGQPGEIIVV